jgi:hypothetical protein
MSEFYRQVFKAGLEAMQQGGTAAELATSDGRYKISQDPVYKRLVLYQLRDIGSSQAWVAFHPEKLEEKIAKSSSDTWKRELAERKDARDAESHQADMVIKKVNIVKLQKRYAPETIPENRVCRIPGCRYAGVTWESRTKLEAHQREEHPERFTDPPRGTNLATITAGGLWGAGGAIQPKWIGQVGD